MADSAREFSILINNQTAEAQADVIRWSSRPGIPVYKDYVVMMKGDKKGRKFHFHLMIELRSLNGLVLGLLKGLEIFKLSDFENSLATPNPASQKRVPTTWNLEIWRLISFFGQSNVIGTSMTFIIICVNATVYSLRKFWEENFQDEKQERSASVEPPCHSFSLAEIKLATQNFSDALVIGKGGFGKVYKGCIRRVPEIVAIKRLNFFSRQGAREFWAEIETLSKLRHIHLVSLIGYCNEHNEMILVYEYISGGTLADNIYRFARKGRDCAPLSWEQRLKICIGAARGLDYLHTGSEYGIIHRDVKDSNILLDKNFVAKISDFGLSKLEKLTQSKSYVSTKIKGTVGYLDPDYCMTHRLTRKTDVYAFGIILLVVLSGRPALDTTNPGESESLLACFQECTARGELDRIVDPNIYRKMPPKSLQEFVKSIENCLQRQPKNGPTMAQLVGSLEQVLQRQERPVISASVNVSVAVQHDKAETIQQFKISQSSVATIPEERVISPPREEITRTNALPRGKKSSFWVWPRKKIQRPARGVTAAKSSDSTDDESAPCLDGHVHKFLEGGVDKIVPFSYEELATATCDFSLADRIGEDSHSTVYFSELRGEKVAIRKMDTERRREFLAELRVLAHVHYRNLVRLIGYCVERSLFLVYEYVDKGNLNLHLRGSGGEPLSWSTRVQIALDSARALEYIHEYTVPTYVHRSICSSAILIDKNFQAKVANFYFAKCIDGGSSICTRLVGRFGYMPPEYVQNGDISPKLDVYAFGVVLYELISAKKAIVMGASTDESKGLVEMFEEVLSLPDPNDDLRKMVDPRLGDSYPFQSVREMAQLARACTHENPQLRPGMRAIVVALLTLSSAPNDSDIGRS